MGKCKDCKYWERYHINWGICLSPSIKRGAGGLNLETGNPKVVITTEWHTPELKTSKFFGCVLFEQKEK